MRLANCWLVAMWIWFASRMRHYAWITRSHSFRGVIPHFGTANVAGWRMFKVIEFVPPKRDLWTRRNWLLVFDGHYRVWHLRVVSVRRWETKEQALADTYFGQERRAERRLTALRPEGRRFPIH